MITHGEFTLTQPPSCPRNGDHLCGGQELDAPALPAPLAIFFGERLRRQSAGRQRPTRLVIVLVRLCPRPASTR